LGQLGGAPRHRLTFDISGTMTEGRLVVQVYGTADDDYHPGGEKRIVLTATDQTVTVEWEKSKLKKIQFVVAGENVTCDVLVRNLQLQ
jgi:hypothetical protein